MKRLIITVMIFLLSSSIAMAQDICESDFTCDGDVDSADVSTFLEDFGRSQFNNPCPPCAPMMPIIKTGQTNCYDELGNIIDCAGTGQDGEYQSGHERYIDNGDGTVTDTYTRLMRLKDANCMATHYPEFDNDYDSGDGKVTWQHALDFVQAINTGAYPLCGAGYTDWKLPNVNEMASFEDSIHTRLEVLPFINSGGMCWTSTTLEASPNYAYITQIGGAVNHGDKNDFQGLVWAVRIIE